MNTESKRETMIEDNALKKLIKEEGRGPLSLITAEPESPIIDQTAFQLSCARTKRDGSGERRLKWNEILHAGWQIEPQTNPIPNLISCDASIGHTYAIVFTMCE